VTRTVTVTAQCPGRARFRPRLSRLRPARGSPTRCSLPAWVNFRVKPASVTVTARLASQPLRLASHGAATFKYCVSHGDSGRSVDLELEGGGAGSLPVTVSLPRIAARAAAAVSDRDY
jgi:hypothetical protein